MHENFRKILHLRRKNIDTTERIRESQEYSRTDRGTPWAQFNAASYEIFGLDERSAAIKENIAAMKVDGSTVFGVDLMGQGRPCLAIGCDEAEAISLDSNEEKDHKLETRLAHLGVNIAHADIFKIETARSLIERVRERTLTGQKLGIVYFRPRGGMTPYDDEFSWKFLYKYYCKPLYDALEINGAILVNFVPDTTYQNQIIEQIQSAFPADKTYLVDSRPSVGQLFSMMIQK